jgi:glycosyltransferase involved in cell wall biosynthesis
MKIVMFTPALHASAIGRMSALVVQALQEQGHELTVARSESEHLLSEPTHHFAASLVRWNDPALPGTLSQADLIVYQVGDNYEFHRGCLEWMPNLPGIVCLHDYFLGHLFWAWAQGHPAEAQRALRTWYPADVADQYFRHSNSDDFIASTSVSAPLTEWIAAMALGVVSHSNWGADRLTAACPGPVRIMPLPYNAPMSVAPAESAQRQGINILTVGHVNPNKRIASVVQAIGKSALLRENVAYRVVGSIHSDTVISLSNLARNYRVNLIISDALDNAALANAIGQADIITCLRWPSLEAASASAIEAMLYGKAVVVTDTHFYSEIPDGCVIKIDPQDELNSLQEALERLCADASLRAALGARAEVWAKATFRADHYAEQLLLIGSQVAAIRPAINAIDWFYETLARWGAQDDMLAHETVRQPLRLFDGA